MAAYIAGFNDLRCDVDEEEVRERLGDLTYQMDTIHQMLEPWGLAKEETKKKAVPKKVVAKDVGDTIGNVGDTGVLDELKEFTGLAEIGAEKESLDKEIRAHVEHMFEIGLKYLSVDERMALSNKLSGLLDEMMPEEFRENNDE